MPVWLCEQMPKADGQADGEQTEQHGDEQALQFLFLRLVRQLVDYRHHLLVIQGRLHRIRHN